MASASEQVVVHAHLFWVAPECLRMPLSRLPPSVTSAVHMGLMSPSKQHYGFENFLRSSGKASGKGDPQTLLGFHLCFHLSSREDKHMDIVHIRESLLLHLELSGWPEFCIALHIALNGWKEKQSPHVACLNFSHFPNSWWLKQKILLWS